MLKMFIILLMILISSMLIFIKHPLSMGIMILTQTLLLSLISGMIISTYWFSYILFLIFLGGLLVLFIYISSIASNELINFSYNFKMFLFISMNFLIFNWFFYWNFINSSNLFINYEMNNLFNMFLMIEENNLNLTKLYNNQTYFLTMMLIIYMFITLIAVIKITNIFFGPLRSFN
uniref:NADH-ubiquinone oxidoreductase chain 6 n=1 Tax=Leptidea morsei TaxID=189911 RepID=A0A059P8W1_9NEOP|nr:NADH dehydrogenase subunit 6 [Leptidea morsei]AFP58827.1 NADH dehydrogenase subunit 6 [Leptidea morsei]